MADAVGGSKKGKRILQDTYSDEEVAMKLQKQFDNEVQGKRNYRSKSENELGVTSANSLKQSHFYFNSVTGLRPSCNEGTVALGDLLSGEYSSCLLSSFLFDIPWLLNQFPRLESVPVLIIHGERHSETIQYQCKSFPNIQIYRPPLPIPFGTHHTKMMILFYKAGVRIAIFTCNILKGDWEQKTQGIYSQDFPLKTLSKSGNNNSKNKIEFDFEEDLKNYLKNLGKPLDSFCQKLGAYDFTGASAILIPSVPGYHKNQDLDRYGHLRLQKILRHYNVLPTNKNASVVCQVSSLGSLDEKWLFKEFLKSLTLKDNIQTPMTKEFYLIWPTVQQVRNSCQGWAAGTSIPCPKNNMKDFLRQYLCRWASTEDLGREHVMPHIKTYLSYTTEGDKKALQWFLLTSSNLSKAAWGTLQKKESQLMIRSYELGVLFLPSLTEIKKVPEFSCTSSESSKLMQVLDPEVTVIANNREDCVNTHHLPIPYPLPPSNYRNKDSPWIWDIAYNEPDLFGETYNP